MKRIIITSVKNKTKKKILEKDGKSFVISVWKILGNIITVLLRSNGG